MVHVIMLPFQKGNLPSLSSELDDTGKMDFNETSLVILVNQSSALSPSSGQTHFAGAA